MLTRIVSRHLKQQSTSMYCRSVISLNHSCNALSGTGEKKTSQLMVGATPARHFCDIKSRHPVVSPHVTIYSFPVAAVTSVTNRICGGALWVGLSGIGVYSAAGGDVGAFVDAVRVSGMVVPAKFLVSFPLLYHYAYSIRHLVSYLFIRMRRSNYYWSLVHAYAFRLLL